MTVRARKAPKAFPPGLTLLEDCLKPMKISQKAFALRIGISPTYLSDILNGKRGISAEMALKFEAALGISAEFWLRKQARWDLQCAKSVPIPGLEKIERFDIPQAA